MATTDRLKHVHVATLLAAGASLSLDPERSHYLCRVLRLRRGDRVLLFDGSGDAFTAQIDSADPRACQVGVGEIAQHQASPQFALHLGQALIKGERLDFVLQKATELGVTDIWLLETQRTEVHVTGARVARRHAHWLRIIEGAAEQCGRLRLPELHEPLALSALVERRPAAQSFLLDPGEPPLDYTPERIDTLLLIGPEGGFTDVERAAAKAAGARSIGLGQSILRADTAPVAALAVLRQAWAWTAP